jgi:preprotein translocase subunit SecG
MLAMYILEESPQSSITWLFWVSLGFFAIMVLVGWLVSRNQKPEESKEKDTKGHH